MPDKLNLVEVAKRTLNKNVLEVAEVLNVLLDYIQDAVWQEANQIFSHKHVRRLVLPHGEWRKLNRGVGTKASQTIDVVEDIGMLEIYAEIDKKIVDSNNNPDQFRWQEDKAFLEGLSQDFADAFIYGDRSVDPEKINGLATRYNALSNGNVWGAGGSGSDLTSIWIVQWGVDKVFFFYPRDSKTTGINVEDKGQVTLEDDNGKKFEGYRTHFSLDLGLAIRDERSIQRICNIKTSGETNIFDPKLLVRAINHMPTNGKGAVIYVNETLKSQMDNDAMDKTNVYYTMDQAYGGPLTRFRGIPVKRIDKILDTESTIS
jgi:hypothetical protein